MKALVKMTAVSERFGQVAEITEVKSGRGKCHAYYRLFEERRLMMRHESINTTVRYYGHLTIEDVAKKVAAL